MQNAHPFFRRFVLTSVGLAALLGAVPRGTAQTTISAASFNQDGTVNSGNTYTLNTFLVTGTYYGASPSTAYISDGSGVSARIYGAAAVGMLTVGSQYTATVTTSNYQNSQEFTTLTNLTLATTQANITVPKVAPSQVSSTTPVPLSPGAAATAGMAYNSLLYSGVTFSITPTTSGALSTTTSVTLTDTASGAAVIFFRSEAATAFTAGTTYDVTASVQSYNGNAEIVSATISAAVPEPGTWAALGCGGLLLVSAWRRSGRVAVGV